MRLLFLTLTVLVLAVSAQAQAVSHMLLRVVPESEARKQELLSYSRLDIVDGESKAEVRIIALLEDLEFLKQHGYAFEVLHEDLEAFYASRLVDSPVATMGGYRTYTEIQTFMDSVHTAHPTITSARFSIGNTLEGRGMWVMKISASPYADNGTPEVFFNSLIHAREPAGMEAVLYFLNWITSNYGIDPTATDLIDNRQIYVLPCVNADGYVYNQTTNPGGGGMWRKNRRLNSGGSYGVDLNRNFDAAWGIDDVGSSPYPTDETYRGTAPFSEVETQHIRDFVNAHQFVTEDDIHTYSNLVLFPWGTSYYPPPSGNGLCPDDDTFRMIADSMTYFIHSVNGVWYTTGTPWQTLYNTNGGSFDWEYGDPAHQKIYAVTTEIGSAADGFWPPSNRIIPLAQENLPALVFMARIAGTLAPRPYAATITGQCESELGGDGDGIIEPAEAFNLSVTLKNTGLNALTGIQGVISTADPYVTITQDTSPWSNLAPNATGANTTLFQIAVHADAPATRFVDVNLHVTAAGLDTNLALTTTIGNSCLYDNVETGTNGWTTGGSNNQWHISTRRANSPTHAWLSGVDVGNYADNMSAYLLSPTLIMGPGAQLVYDQWYNIESNYDYGYAEVNTGAGWTQVGTTITGSSGNWVHVAQNLNITCPGTPVQIRFRMTSDGNTNAEGWYLDNINTGCPPPPTVTVNAPNGGETWLIGDNGNIAWTTANLTGNIKIELNRTYPGVTWETLFANIANDGSEPWTISGPATSAARIRVSSVTTPAVSDTSNANFTTGSPGITLTAPNGGEGWITGVSYNFTWVSINLAENVKIELDRAFPSGIWETIVASTANDGSHAWSAAGAATTTARARITGVTHTTTGDTSAADFTIGPRSITVTQPNGGDIWFVGETRSFTWDSFGITGSVWINMNRLYPIGTWETISLSTPNDGTFDWTVAGELSPNVRVRINSVDFPAVSDLSDNDFRIASPNQPPLMDHDALHDVLPVAFTITADVTDDFGEFTVGLHYKPSGAVAYDSLAMNATGNPDEYAATVGPLNSGAYLYYLKAVDAMGATATTTPTLFYVQPANGGELAYDDGIPERSNWSDHPGETWAVKFTPPAIPFALNFARIGVSAEHPDLSHSPISVEILLADGPGGLPGTSVLARAAAGSIGNVIGGVPLSPPNYTYVVLQDLSGNPLLLNSDFYIAVSNPALGFTESFLEDTNGVYAGQSFVFDACDSTWHNESEVHPAARRGNRMIHAGGYGLIPPIVVLANAGPDMRLRWTNMDAPFYHIYSASTEGGPFSNFVGSTADTTYLEAGGASSLLKFYQIRSSTAP